MILTISFLIFSLFFFFFISSYFLCFPFIFTPTPDDSSMFIHKEIIGCDAHTVGSAHSQMSHHHYPWIQRDISIRQIN